MLRKNLDRLFFSRHDQSGEEVDFDSSFAGLPKSSSALSSEMQRPIRMHSSMASDKKIQQDEDERNPRFMQLQKEKLSFFWKLQKEEILQSDPKRKHELPISRIRRAMKSNDQVKMVSTHSTVLFSKAIEMFILELTLRAWMQADQVKRQTLKRDDFARAIRNEELFNFLSDIVPLQTHKFQVEEANDGQGNEFYAAYQMTQPDNIPYQFQVEEANDVQGNKFHLADQMVQPHNILLPQLDQFQVGDGQGNECYRAYRIFQPNDIPVEEANDVQGNKFHLANRMVQPHNIPVKGNADDGQDSEFHPAYQMVQPDNIPCQFQVQKKAKYGQGNKFQARELKLLSEALIKAFDLPAHQMVQPNNIPCQYQVQEANDGQGNEFHPACQTVQPSDIPASFISIPGSPAPSSPEAEFNIDEFLVDNEEDL